MNTLHDDELKIAIEAVEWLDRAKSRKRMDQKALQAWLRESPEHIRHFLMASEMDRDLDFLLPKFEKVPANARGIPHLTLIRDARAVEPASGGVGSTRSKSFALVKKVVALAACMMVATVAVYVTRAPTHAIEYTTSVGERRSVPLVDGSVMNVNTASRLEVTYTRKARNVRLLSGEALFDVARDKARPFRVQVNRTVVEAVGTQFVVHKLPDDSAVVSVLEGSVQVLGNGVAVPVVAGELTKIRSDATVEPAVRGNVLRVSAWREGFVQFEEETLANIATELNRYSDVKFVVESDQVRELRFTLTLRTDNPKGLVESLKHEPGLIVEEQDTQVTIRPETARKSARE
jgi:transmembrane sensor